MKELITEIAKSLVENPDEVKNILDKGTQTAREKAINKMAEVKKAMKIDY